jgi:cytoskeletal protein RodZ
MWGERSSDDRTGGSIFLLPLVDFAWIAQRRIITTGECMNTWVRSIALRASLAVTVVAIGLGGLFASVSATATEEATTTLTVESTATEEASETPPVEATDTTTPDPSVTAVVTSTAVVTTTTTAEPSETTTATSTETTTAEPSATTTATSTATATSTSTATPTDVEAIVQQVIAILIRIIGEILAATPTP